MSDESVEEEGGVSAEALKSESTDENAGDGKREEEGGDPHESEAEAEGAASTSSPEESNTGVVSLRPMRVIALNDPSPDSSSSSDRPLVVPPVPQQVSAASNPPPAPPSLLAAASSKPPPEPLLAKADSTISDEQAEGGGPQKEDSLKNAKTPSALVVPTPPKPREAASFISPLAPPSVAPPSITPPGAPSSLAVPPVPSSRPSPPSSVKAPSSSLIPPTPSTRPIPPSPPSSLKPPLPAIAPATIVDDFEPIALTPPPSAALSESSPKVTPPPPPASSPVIEVVEEFEPLSPLPPDEVAFGEAPSKEIDVPIVTSVSTGSLSDTPVPPKASWAPSKPGAVASPAEEIDLSFAAPAEVPEELRPADRVDEVEIFSPESDGVLPPSEPPPPKAEQKPPPPKRQTKPSLPKVRKPRKKAWWETLFGDDFSRAYRAMTPSQLVREVDFILQSLDVPPGSVILDLGCGQGEICVELSRRGYSVVGYDLSVYQLAMAGDNAQSAGQKINFLQGDMREMAFEEMFDAVICWDTTFGYFEEEKNLEVLSRIKRALKPQGRLLIDVMNRDFAAREAPYTHWFAGDGCVCMDDMSMDWITNRMAVKRSIILDDGRSKELQYTTRLYNLSEVGRMLHDAGFRVAEVSGHIAARGAFFGPHSRRIMIQAGKP